MSAIQSPTSLWLRYSIWSIWACFIFLGIFRLFDSGLLQLTQHSQLKTLGLSIPLLIVVVLSAGRAYLIKRKHDNATLVVDQVGRVVIHLILAYSITIALVDALKALP